MVCSKLLMFTAAVYYVSAQPATSPNEDSQASRVSRVSRDCQNPRVNIVPSPTILNGVNVQDVWDTKMKPSTRSPRRPESTLPVGSARHHIASP